MTERDRARYLQNRLSNLLIELYWIAPPGIDRLTGGIAPGIDRKLFETAPGVGQSTRNRTGLAPWAATFHPPPGCLPPAICHRGRSTPGVNTVGITNAIILYTACNNITYIEVKLESACREGLSWGL